MRCVGSDSSEGEVQLAEGPGAARVGRRWPVVDRVVI